MSQRIKFFVCRHCGNLVGLIHNAGVPMVCCGESMSELTPNTVDASQEKHVPAVDVSQNKVDVRIGSAPHPMEDAHYIEWVYLETKKGGQRKRLVPGDKPEVTFALVDDTPLAVFAYCNLHSLWKVELA